MAKSPPIDLQAALAAAKAKLAEPPKRVSSPPVNVAPQSKIAKPKAAQAKGALLKEDSSLTLEKLAQAWVQTKNFPKRH
jgi:ABC-type Fe2+-enterobactin transport system substrate-binding protein